MKKKVLIGISGLVIGILILGIAFYTIYTIDSLRVKNNCIETELEPKQEQKKYVSLEKLPKEYSFEQALRDECFIITNKEVYHKSKLEEFIKNTSINSTNRIPDKIRIIQYTVEGDMIITDVEYLAEDKYIVTIDNTRDKFLNEEDRVITTKENFPGQYYGIIEREENEFIKIELAIYAEVSYVKEIEVYQNYTIGTYPKNAIINEAEPSFIGTILEIKEKSVLVETQDIEANRSNNQFQFTIPEGNNLNFSKGNLVKVTYTGLVLETYPAQINVIKLQLIEN